MTSRIATEAEITSIDTWADGLGTVGSAAAVDISFNDTFDSNNSEWITLTTIEPNEESTEATFTITYNSSILDADAGTFNTTDVVKVFSLDSSLVPDGPEEEEASEE